MSQTITCSRSVRVSFCTKLQPSAEHKSWRIPLINRASSGTPAPVERWPSGRRRSPAKGVYRRRYRGFESHPLRHNDSQNRGGKYRASPGCTRRRAMSGTRPVPVLAPERLTFRLRVHASSIEFPGRTPIRVRFGLLTAAAQRRALTLAVHIADAADRLADQGRRMVALSCAPVPSQSVEFPPTPTRAPTSRSAAFQAKRFTQPFPSARAGMRLPPCRRVARGSSGASGPCRLNRSVLRCPVPRRSALHRACRCRTC